MDIQDEFGRKICESLGEGWDTLDMCMRSARLQQFTEEMCPGCTMYHEEDEAGPNGCCIKQSDCVVLKEWSEGHSVKRNEEGGRSMNCKGEIVIKFDENPDGEWDLHSDCTREQLAFAIALLQSTFTDWMNTVKEEEEEGMFHRGELVEYNYDGFKAGPYRITGYDPQVPEYIGRYLDKNIGHCHLGDGKHLKRV